MKFVKDVQNGWKLRENHKTGQKFKLYSKMSFHKNVKKYGYISSKATFLIKNVAAVLPAAYKPPILKNNPPQSTSSRIIANSSPPAETTPRSYASSFDRDET